MKKILLCFLMIHSLIAGATTEWTHVFGGRGNEDVRKIVSAKGGGWITVGSTQSFGDADNNVFVVRWNGDGQVIWETVVGDSLDNFGYSAAQDVNGFIYVAGSSNGLGTLGLQDVYLAKLDSSGNVLWQKTYGGTNNEVANSIVIDSLGEIVLAGTTQSSGSGGSDAYVLKVDSSGTLLWSKTYGGTGTDILYAITTVTGGGFVVAGSTTSFSTNHGYAARINNNGDTIWTKSYNLGSGSGVGGFTDVKQFLDTSLIFTGLGGNYNYSNMFHLKTNLNGTLNYFKLSGSLADGGQSIVSTSDSCYTIAGFYSNFGTCGVVRKFSSTGVQLWERYIQQYYFHNYSFFSELWSIVENADGTYTMAGGSELGADLIDGLIIHIDSTGCTMPVMNTVLSASPSANFCDSASVNTTLIAPVGFVSYQWFYLDGALHPIDGAVSNTFHTTTAGRYYCLLTTADNLWYSQPIVVSVTSSIATPVVSPSGVFNGCLAASATEGRLTTVNTIGLNFQWLLNGSPIPGANNYYYSATTDGMYSVITYNNCGSDTSDVTEMHLNEGPQNVTITTTGDTIFCRRTQSLSLNCNYHASYNHYTWLVNNSFMANSANQYYQSVYVSGNYSVVVSNQCGTDTSSYISVLADSNSAPVIRTNGTPDLKVYNSSGTNYYCGSHPLAYSGQNYSASYVWKLNGTVLPATNSTYSATQPGSYTLTITDSCGTSPESIPFIVNATQVNDSVTVTNGNACTYTILNAPPNTSSACQWYLNGSPTGFPAYTLQTTLGGNFYCTYQPAGCLSPIPSNTVTISAASGYPNISVNPSNSVCSGSILLTASTTGASYVWKLDGVVIPGANSQTYSATQTGKYTCVVSIPGCLTDSGVVSVSIGNDKIVSNRPMLCPGGYVNLGVLVYDNTFTYQWRLNGIDIAGQTNYYLNNINQAGTYDLRITGACGTYLTNSIVLNSAPHTLSPSGTISICDGDVLNLTAPSGAGYTYEWHNYWSSLNDTNQTLSVSTAISTFCCNTNYLKAYITIPGVCSYYTDVDTVIPHRFPANGIYPSTSPEWCGSGSVELNARISPDYNYQWYKNNSPVVSATSDQLLATSSGDYFVSIEYFPGCFDSSNVVSVNSNSISGAIVITGEQELCHGDSVELQLEPAASTYQWYRNDTLIPGATSQSYIAYDGGNYSVIFSNASGCTGSSSVPIYSISLINSPINAVGTNFCLGDSVRLTVSTYSGNQWYFNGTAIQGATSSALYASQNGNYKVITTQNCCAVSADSVDLQFNSTPVAVITSAQTSLCNASSISLVATPGNGLHFQWKKNGVDIPGATYVSFAANSAGNYSCEVTTDCGVALSNTISITAPFAASLSASGATTVCAPDSVHLNATPVGANYQYQWRKDNALIPGATTSSYYASASGNYSVQISDANGCYNMSNTVYVNVLSLVPAPVVTTNMPTICPNGSLQMSVDSTLYNSYQWRLNGMVIPGATQADYTASATGVYDCVVTNSCGSGASLPVYVTAGLSPVVNLGNDTTLCLGSTIILSAGYGVGYAYLWSDFSTSPYVYLTSQIQVTDSISVLVTNSYGCTASDSLTVNFSVCAEINSPTEISGVLIYPNPANEHLFIYHPAEENYTINVYDLAGRSILSQKSQSNTTELDLSHYVQGVYLVVVNGVHGVCQKKIIKE